MPTETAKVANSESQRQMLMNAIAAEDRRAVLKIAADTHYADLAHIYLDLDEEKHADFLTSIGPDLAANMLVKLPAGMVEDILDFYPPPDLSILFRELSDDDRVDLLQAVGEEARQRFLGLLGPEDEELTRSLLRYEPNTAGGRMTTHFGRLFPTMTVAQAIEALKEKQELAETYSRNFVVDEKGHLIGRVRFRHLAFNSSDTLIRDIMTEVPHEETSLATADQEEAALTLLKYDLLVLPVVDEFNHLLGIITHDDAMEILREESTEDFERFGGLTSAAGDFAYLKTSVFDQFRRRSGWLVGLAFVSIASGYVMMHFDEVLSSAFVLALFLPMTIASGGNSGGQATTMVIRAMSLKELGKKTAGRVARKELLTGALLGLLLGLCMAIFILMILPHFKPTMPDGITFGHLALAVGTALTIQVTSATFLGSLLPYLARFIKFDPAVVSAPAIAAIVDISGMLIYFTTASAILSI